MSKGFGESDFAQILSDKATSESVQRLLDENRQQAERASSRRATGEYGVCEDCSRRSQRSGWSSCPRRLAASVARPARSANNTDLRQVVDLMKKPAAAMTM